MNDEAQAAAARFAKRNRFMLYNHICYGASGPDWFETYLDLVPESTNPFGLVHGGAFFTMADCCAGMTARLDGRQYVTQSAAVEFIRNVDHGRITAHGTVLNRGGHVCLVQVEIHGEDGRLLFHGTFSMFCVAATQE